jgi:hypothetical protein
VCSASDALLTSTREDRAWRPVIAACGTIVAATWLLTQAGAKDQETRISQSLARSTFLVFIHRRSVDFLRLDGFTGAFHQRPSTPLVYVSIPFEVGVLLCGTPADSRRGLSPASYGAREWGKNAWV